MTDRRLFSLRIPLLVGVLLASSTCDSVRTSPPLAQPSATADATNIVRVQKGVAFSAACLQVPVGATVEWRNLTPSSSIILLSIADPYELSSPALLLPYNIMPAEQSDECTQKKDGTCDPAFKIAYSYWRHTFTTPGIFDYVDQAGSSTASGSYSYGLPAGPSTSSGGGSGTVCVYDATHGCNNVCCTGAVTDECATGVSCIGSRCGGVIR